VGSFYGKLEWKIGMLEEWRNGRMEDWSGDAVIGMKFVIARRNDEAISLFLLAISIEIASLRSQ